MLKFLIVGENNIDKIPLIEILSQYNNHFKISKIFSTNNEDLKDKYHYYISNDELNICYKNNAILFIKTIINHSYGITLDSFYENNIIFMNTEDFNNISNKIFLGNNELIIIWLDTKEHDPLRIKKEIRESTYLLEKIENDNLKYMYFLDKDYNEISNIIIDYFNSDEITRKTLLENNS